MNYCNFIKVIIARSTKDSASIERFNSPVEKSKKTKDGSDNKFIAKYNSSISFIQRHENYNIFMNKYKALSIESYDKFKQQCLRIQNYVTNNKYYQNSNHSGERNKFLEHFSLIKWLDLTESERKQHTLENCKICNITHAEASALHKASYNENPIAKCCVNLMETAADTSNSTPDTHRKKTVKNIVQVLEPVFQSNFDTSFKSAISEALHLSPTETVTEKKKKVLTVIKDTNKQVWRNLVFRIKF